jgi:hypothetical protein
LSDFAKSAAGVSTTVDMQPEAGRRLSLSEGIEGLFSSTCNYLDKSSVAQILGRSLRGAATYVRFAPNEAGRYWDGSAGGVRMTEEFQDAMKAWAKKQTDNPPLATAVRRLLKLWLKAEGK